MKRLSLRICAAGLSAALAAAAPAQTTDPAHRQAPTGDANMLQTPSSLGAEHHELHARLGRAADEGGRLGETAQALERLLAPHFRREEEIATPPLGLLVPLSQGEVMPAMRAVLPMTEALERELPRMLDEHQAIRAAVAAFRAAAEAAGREEYVRFSDELAAHARQEEEILYPAAVLVGRYVARAGIAAQAAPAGVAGEHVSSNAPSQMRHRPGCDCPCCRAMPHGGADQDPPASQSEEHEAHQESRPD